MVVRHSPGVRRVTLGGDKGSDAASFVADMRALSVMPHITQTTSGQRALDTGLRVTPAMKRQRTRKRIEEPWSTQNHRYPGDDLTFIRPKLGHHRDSRARHRSDRRAAAAAFTVALLGHPPEQVNRLVPGRHAVM
jgi:hypothetical protein